VNNIDNLLHDPIMGVKYIGQNPGCFTIYDIDKLVSKIQQDIINKNTLKEYRHRLSLVYTNEMIILLSIFNRYYTSSDYSMLLMNMDIPPNIYNDTGLYDNFTSIFMDYSLYTFNTREDIIDPSSYLYGDRVVFYNTMLLNILKLWSDSIIKHTIDNGEAGINRVADRLCFKLERKGLIGNVDDAMFIKSFYNILIRTLRSFLQSEEFRLSSMGHNRPDERFLVELTQDIFTMLDFSNTNPGEVGLSNSIRLIQIMNWFNKGSEYAAPTNEIIISNLFAEIIQIGIHCITDFLVTEHTTLVWNKYEIISVLLNSIQI